VRKQEEVEVQMSLGSQLHLSEGSSEKHVTSVQDSERLFHLSKGGMDVRVIRRFCDQFYMVKGMGYMICIHSNK
jgi:hypothetical protein